MNKKALIQYYIDGWKNGNEAEILDVLSDDCIIIESHGPTYRGKEIVKKWISDWFGKGNVIEKWKLTSFHTCDDMLFCEWVFIYKGKKIRESFLGMTIAKIKKGKISDLREYRMTEFPFIWRHK